MCIYIIYIYIYMCNYMYIYILYILYIYIVYIYILGIYIYMYNLLKYRHTYMINYNSVPRDPMASRPSRRPPAVVHQARAPCACPPS